MNTSVIRYGGLWVLVMLSAAGLASAASPDLRLVSAVAAQDAQAVRALLDEGIDVNASRADGATALLWAAHWDDFDTADRLLRAGAHVNAADDHGVTPLARACENGSVAMVATLLAAHADANAAQASGLTPLMTAARTGTVAVVEALLAHGADVHATTAATRSTAVMWAVAERHPAIVRVLVAHGADPQVSTSDGFTPLLYAAHNGDVAMAEILLAAGVDMDATGVGGTHPLPYAIITRQDAFALFLLERGADPNGSMGGIRALHAAAGSVAPWLGEWNRRRGDGRWRSEFGTRALPPRRRLPLITALLARGADPNARITTTGMFMADKGYPTKGAFETYSLGTGDLRGATPLWVAANASNRGGASDQVELTVEILRTLLAAGADQHLTTDDGTTPLMAAAGLGLRSYSPREPRGAPIGDRRGGGRNAAGGGCRRQRRQRSRLHGAARRGVPWTQRGDRVSRGERGRHQRAGFQRPDPVPCGAGRQASVQLPGVAGNRRVPEGAGGESSPRHPGDGSRATARCRRGGSLTRSGSATPAPDRGISLRQLNRRAARSP